MAEACLLIPSDFSDFPLSNGRGYLHRHGANNREINPYLHHPGICLQALVGGEDILILFTLSL
jgi:hypothetical protein